MASPLPKDFFGLTRLLDLERCRLEEKLRLAVPVMQAAVDSADKIQAIEKALGQLPLDDDFVDLANPAGE